MADSQLIFDKYRLVKRIAIGGMGEIFLARQSDTLIDRFIILKSMLPDLATNQTFVDQFLGEARVAATLNHPNIVSIYEVGAWEGIYYIAMEYIDGDDLTRLITGAQHANRLIPPVIAAQIILEAATALEHASLAKDLEGQALNIVHRDISPQNIMLRRDGVVKVVDFGIARAANLVSKTVTGQVKGKLSYMPPEQLVGTKVDWRADQFSLGVVLWELCTCDRLIKPGTSHLKLIETKTKVPMEDPRTVEPSIPDSIAEIILKMGEREADDRYQSWAEIKENLDEFIRSQESSKTDPTIAQLQEELIGKELDEKSKEATGSTPENFMINLKNAATVPVGSAHDDDDEDDIATRAHDISKIQPQEAKQTKVDKPQPVAPLEKKKRSPLVAILLAIVLGIGIVGILSQQNQSPSKTEVQEPQVPIIKQIPLSIQINGPAGTTVSINGVIIANKAPTLLENLEHGEHHLILTKEGYPPIRQTITLDGSVNPLIVNPALPPAFAMVVLKSRPKKVGIYQDGVLIGSTGETPLPLSPGQTHHLELKKPGFKTYKLSLAPKAGQTIEQKIVLTRAKSKSKEKAPKHVSQPLAPQLTKTVIETKTVVIEDKLGFITLKTTPWTNVSIDDRPYGATPIFKRELKTGKYTIRMVRKLDDGSVIDQKRTITIESGKTNKLNWTLTP